MVSKAQKDSAQTKKAWKLIFATVKYYVVRAIIDSDFRLVRTVKKTGETGETGNILVLPY